LPVSTFIRVEMAFSREAASAEKATAPATASRAQAMFEANLVI
jgi:hypothetical protein